MSLEVIRGTSRKPASSKELDDILSSRDDLNGLLFIGHPIVRTSSGPFPIDALLISEDVGIIAFDLIEGTDASDHAAKQDDIANRLDSMLRTHPGLTKRRVLQVPIYTISFAPGVTHPGNPTGDCPLTNTETVIEAIQGLKRTELSETLYKMSLSAIESISTIRQSRTRRTIHRPDSLGARLRDLEASISTLDHKQNVAAHETVEGIQRIRGLAGSGKTVALALKATYLHLQHPDWRIAVTFNTRSLRGFFQSLIQRFTIDKTGDDPDWERLRILGSWGASGGSDQDGIYREFCRAHDLRFFDFGSARQQFGSVNAFRRVCEIAEGQAKENRELYDAILVDEAQDLSPAFLRMCHSMLRNPKRLVYAYDELQSLSGESLPSPEEIFGNSLPDWNSDATSDGPRRDIILENCYRNSRPVLVAAHALGFGVYRQAPEHSETGLIQMFDNPRLWEDVGYHVDSGNLLEGHKVVLKRTEDTSPLFLEKHSDIDELIKFVKFETEEEQAEWLAQAISKNLYEDEMRHDDIIVINPDPLTTRGKIGYARRILYDRTIPSHLAGVDTDANTFYKTNTPSVTFTGIHRAKGNEAGMVYVLNAQDCHSTARNLATLRNRLFTAITRSKSWIRVLGVGQGMEAIMTEFEALKKSGFVLDFIYPTADQRQQLRIIHRDARQAGIQGLEDWRPGIEQLMARLESGEVLPEDLGPDTLTKLRELLG